MEITAPRDEEIPEIDPNACNTPRGEGNALLGNILPEMPNPEKERRYWVVTARFHPDPRYALVAPLPGKTEVFAMWKDAESGDDGGYELAKRNAQIKTDAVEEEDKIRGYAVYGDFTKEELEDQIWLKDPGMLPACGFDRVTSWQGREFLDYDENVPKEERKKNTHRIKITNTILSEYGHSQARGKNSHMESMRRSMVAHGKFPQIEASN